MTDAGRPAPEAQITRWAGLAGLAGLCIGVAAARIGQWPAGMALVVGIGGALSGCILAEGLPNAVRLHAARPNRAGGLPAAGRIATKTVGLLALFGLAVAAFHIFPFFRDSRLATDMAAMARPIPIVVAAVLALIYIALCDRVMPDPEDSLYQVGKAVSMRTFRTGDVLFSLRGLAIKVFFLTLMWDASLSGIEGFLSFDLSATRLASPALFGEITRLLFLADAMLAAMGYLATLRLFDWHVRATEVTVFGWGICLACYPPFFTALSVHFLAFANGPDGHAMITESSPFFIAWNLAIIACHLVFVWATVSFGARFSNLTHRGIVRHGPYRFVRHPAYLAKTLAWWLIFLPAFLSGDLLDGVARGVMLAAFTGCYVMRAMAEERMLSADPAYRNYRDHIDRHGLAARCVAFLQPSRPRNRTGL